MKPKTLFLILLSLFLTFSCVIKTNVKIGLSGIKVEKDGKSKVNIKFWPKYKNSIKWKKLQ